MNSNRPTQIIKILKKSYPDAHCALNFSNPFELLIATILSAQCTDERVNIVTKVLFKELPSPKEMAAADVLVIEGIIRSTGFYKAKAKNLKLCATSIMENHGGKVPNTMEALVKLAGVGRKTANVVLGNAFGIASGVVVDTHVMRLCNRLDLVRSEDAVKIETKLNKMIPKEHWIMFSHWLIAHGRKICKARSPNCEQCPLLDLCPKRTV